MFLLIYTGPAVEEPLTLTNANLSSMLGGLVQQLLGQYETGKVIVLTNIVLEIIKVFF